MRSLSFLSPTRDPALFRGLSTPAANQQCLYLSPPDVRWRGSCKNTLEGSLLPCIHDDMVPRCSTIVQVSPHAMGSGSARKLKSRFRQRRARLEELERGR